IFGRKLIQIILCYSLGFLADFGDHVVYFLLQTSVIQISELSFIHFCRIVRHHLLVGYKFAAFCFGKRRAWKDRNIFWFVFGNQTCDLKVIVVYIFTILIADKVPPVFVVGIAVSIVVFSVIIVVFFVSPDD